jgi:hypothetical protein
MAATTTSPAVPGTATTRIARTGRAARAALRPFTTPGQLRLGLVVLVTATIVFGVVAVRSVVGRLDAAREVGNVATPQLVASQDVYASLADADAAASSAFLAGGKDTAALQAEYRNDLSNASQQLAEMARRADSVSAREAVATITKQLPVYAGLVSAAQANNLQGLVVGNAYLHEASQLMRNTILPAATVVYENAAAQFGAADRRGSSPLEIGAVVILGAVLVALLASMLVFLAIRMRRTINIGLAAALVIVLALTTTLTVAFAQEQHALQRSQSVGSDPLQVLSAARILALRTFSDENLDLIERGAASSYLPDFNTLTADLTNDHGTGLLDSAYVPAAISADFGRYFSAHRQVRKANDFYGDHSSAVSIATKQEAPAMAALDAAFRGQIAAARTRLETSASDARSGLSFVGLLTVLFALLAATAIVFGLRPRIKEYA